MACNNLYTYGGGVELMHVRVIRQIFVFFIYLKYASYLVDTYTIPMGNYFK